MPIARHPLPGVPLLGVVFTTFLDLLDERFGMAVTEEVLDRCTLAGKGAYTAVGDYPYGDLLQMVDALQEVQDVPPGEILQELGLRLAQHARRTCPTAFEEGGTFMGFLDQLEERLHLEVLSLRDGQPLPVRVRSDDEGRPELSFTAQPHLEYLAAGAVKGCADAFHQPIRTEVCHEPGRNEVRLRITLDA